MTRSLTASRLLIVLLIFVPEARGQSRDARDHWVATWGTAQQLYRAPVPARAAPSAPPPAAATGAATTASPAATTSPATSPAPQPPAPQGRGGPQRRFGIPPALPGISNQTVRMIVRSSLGGTRVRVRLFNALGSPAVPVGSAHVAVRAAGAGIVAGSDRVLTFSGRPSATLYAGATLVSDPVALTVAPLTDLAVSLYLPGETGPPTSHTFGLRPTYVSTPGDFAGAADIIGLAATTQSYYWLAGVDVAAAARAAAVVTFGDSITDGDQSTPDTSGMWPALLARRLQADRRTAHVGVVNTGISGNRLLGDNNSGLARFAVHALTVPGVRWVTLLEGINDITAATRTQPPGSPPPPAFTADDLIAAYRQVIAAAHLHGIKVIGCTLTPFGGSNVFTETGEAIRTKANDWIRTSGAFDAVVDFDAATRDAADPTRFRAEADSPDLLHPGDGGYRLMAEAFELAIFRTAR